MQYYSVNVLSKEAGSQGIDLIISLERSLFADISIAVIPFIIVLYGLSFLIDPQKEFEAQTGIFIAIFVLLISFNQTLVSNNQLMNVDSGLGVHILIVVMIGVVSSIASSIIRNKVGSMTSKKIPLHLIDAMGLYMFTPTFIYAILLWRRRFSLFYPPIVSNLFPFWCLILLALIPGLIYVLANFVLPHVLKSKKLKLEDLDY